MANRQLFDEVYPASESESDSESDSASSDDEAKAEHSHLTSAREMLHHARDKLAIARDSAGNAQRRLQLLEDLGKLSDRKNNDFITVTLDQYKEERIKAFDDLTESNKLQRKLVEEVEKAEKKLNKLQRQEDRKNAKEDKAKARARKEKEKKKALRERLKGEARREKERLRDEQRAFWPLDVYSVRITLEVAAFTPMTSRRGSTTSVDVDVDMGKISTAEADQGNEEEDAAAAPVECDLTFSYVTAAAYWSPSYDLQLSTTKASASLYFDAMLTNQTSETWRNCKVTLSTSQATFSGLDDKIPELAPWRIKLGAWYGGFRDNNDAITRSNEEIAAANANLFDFQNFANVPQKKKKRAEKAVSRRAVEESDEDMGFGLFDSAPPPPRPMAPPAPVPAPAGGLFGSAAAAGPPRGGSMFQHEALRAGAPPPPPPPPAPQSFGHSLFGASAAAPAAVAAAAYRSADPMVDRSAIPSSQTQLLSDFDYDAFNPNDSHEASLMEETGLTTTYDLPGRKTLAPKYNGSKQRVARIAFANVVFSHTVVAKYKPVAYLQAKLKNGSKLALLRGTASLTLDGSFMGKTTLPRCSAGEAFTLGLGVDPAIRVTYAKPEVRRATSGLFSKEDSAVYLRTVTLHNTRAVGGRAVTLAVLDQVPVSEDERLRVEVLHPRGLAVDGNGVVTGVSGKEEERGGDDWGRASAKLKKEGKVTWDVSLNAGKAVKLALEYGVSMPSGENAHQV